VTRRVVLDTGPLVALLDRGDRYHAWTRDAFAAIGPPLLTCEAVVAEAWHLLRRFSKGRDAILDLLARNVIVIAFDLGAEILAVRKLAARYASVPMSLADACLVRMTELYADAAVVTLDSDFSVYRKHGRQVITLVQPAS
jgi:predicted nucleic acid-binding protein